MDLKLIEGQRGKQHLIHKGFELVIDKNGKEKIFWKCTFRYKVGCKFRVHTDINNQILKELGIHNHTPEVSDIYAKNLMSKIKKKAKETLESPAQILTSIDVSF